MRARALCILIAAFLVTSAAPSSATVPPTKCGKVEVRQKSFKVKSHKTKCRFARRWSRKVLNGSKGPPGWSCERYSKRETSIAFVCRKAGKDFFAIRK